MDIPRIFNIAESAHRIHNPITPEKLATEPESRRPVLIVQTGTLNASRIEMVLAAIISSNLALAESPGNVLVRASRSGLRRDSVVSVSQIVTLAKSFILEHICSLSCRKLAEVEDGLRLVLGL